MSVVGARRAREFAHLQATGWTVITETPLDRLRAALRRRRARRAGAGMAPVERVWLR